MCRALLGVVSLLAGLAAAAQAGDGPDPLKGLPGQWQRPLVDGLHSFAVPAGDGVNTATPELILGARGEARSLVVGGSPHLVYWNPRPYDTYDLATGKGAEKGRLFLIVDKRSGRRVPFEY